MAMSYESDYQPIGPGRLWFGVGAPPVIWALHLVIVYAIQSVSCHWGFLQFTILGINALRFVLLVITLLAAIGVLAGGLVAYRSYQEIDGSRDMEDETGWLEGRFMFMAQSGVLLAGLFLFALVLTIFPIIFLQPCSLFWW